MTTQPKTPRARTKAEPKRITTTDASPIDSVTKTTREKPSYFRELTDLQLRACELAGDLIMNGGAHDDVSGLLYNLMVHDWRRRFQHWPEDPARDAEKAEKHGEQFWPAWYDKLSKHWPEKQTAPERPEPTAVVEMARENARRRLERIFAEDFISNASPEEMYFLREVLEDATGGDMSLPEAFAYETTMDHTFVKVPHRHVKLVEKYIALLAEGDEARGNAA